MLKQLTGVAAATAATLALGTIAPAQADSIGVRDADDINHGVDLRAVHVENTDTFLRISLSHTNLRRDFRSGSSGAVYIDTDRNDVGPELVFLGGYYEGSDYQLLKTEGFGSGKWGKPVQGYYQLRLDFDSERTVMRISRQAVGANDVRVAVKVGGTRADGSNVIDWLKEPRSFTRWVARG